MDDNRPKLYARLRARIGSYEQDGKSKNRYADIGVLFASPHFSNMYMQIDTLPISKDWDGRIYVNPIEENKQIQLDDFKNEEPKNDKQMTHEFNKKITQDAVIDDIDDKPIDLSSIPF